MRPVEIKLFECKCGTIHTPPEGINLNQDDKTNFKESKIQTNKSNFEDSTKIIFSCPNCGLEAYRQVIQ